MTKWKSIQAGKYEIVFAPELEEEAKKLANIVQELDGNLGDSLSVDSKKITIILDNANAYSNGYVALLPRRSLFYHIPPSSSLYYEDWTFLLAVHEMRHVVQFDKLNTGDGLFYYILLGEPGQGVMSFLFMPRWFSEGDSVYLETAFTNTGRGRLPEFTMLTRTQVLSGNLLSYSTAYYGSYLRAAPGPYELGYLLVAYTRKKYGEQVWGDIMSNVAKHSYFPPWLFSRSLVKYTGKTKRQLYAEAMDALKDEWKRQDPSFYDQPVPLNASRRVFTEYRNPVLSSEDKLYVQKRGKFTHNSIVEIDENGKEKPVRLIPESAPGFSARKDRFVWEELVLNFRWDASHSILKLYDRQTSKTKILVSDLDLKDPSLSPDGKIVAAVGYDKSARGYLTLWDFDTTKMLSQTPIADKETLLQISWGNFRDRVFVLTQGWKGRNIYVYNLAKSKFETVVKRIPAYLDSLFAHGNHLYFHGTFDGIDNIFVLRLNDKEMFQVTNSLYGAFDPFVSEDGKTLYYSDFSPLGRNLVQKKIQPGSWKSVTVKALSPLLIEEENLLKFDWEKIAFADSPLPVKRYSPFLNSIHIHSWSFLPVLGNAFSTISLASTDKLNLLDVYASYNFLAFSNTWGAIGGLQFRGMYPIISLNGSYTNVDHFSQRTTGSKISYQSKSFNGFVTFPMRFSRGLVTHEVSLTVGGQASQIENYKEGNHDLPSENGTFQNAILVFQHYLHKSGNTSLFLYSPFFTESIGIVYQKLSPFTFRNEPENILVQGDLSFAGFFHNSTIHLYTDYAQTNSTGLSGRFARGYKYAAFFNGIGSGIDFTFLLIYADINLIPWTLFLYCKVIKLNLFYDYTFLGNYPSFSGQFRSTGAELLFELIPFDLPVSFDTGMRFVYLIENGAYKFLPVLSFQISVAF